MSFPPIPAPPRDAYGRRIEDVNGLAAVWAILLNALASTLPGLLIRLAYDIDSHR